MDGGVDSDAAPAIVANPAVRIQPRPPQDDEFDAAVHDEPGSQYQRVKRTLATLAIVLAVLALVGEALWVFRTNLAAAVPSLRPVLERLCQPLACTVGYARHIEHLTITASSLQTEPAAQPGGAARLQLGFTLRNRHTQPQHWPALMLELRDFSDTVVVRRALLPDEYLSPDAAAHPLAAGAEVKLSVPLTVAGVKDINGYQIRPFYP